jgi:uncharacterized protein (DUF1501 family)
MDTVTRRKFLQLTAGAVAVGAAAPLLSVDEIAVAAINRPLAAGTPIVVMVTLYGGNDGLNTVIPFTDPLYYSSRPEISYKAENMLPLDAELALNPAMKGLKSLWDQKKVAIIRGVGYPDSDRSHFSSMAIWQSAERIQTTKSGWLGRWVDTQPEDPLLAINLGSVLPPLLVGKKRSGSVLPLGGLVTPTGSLARDCSRLSLPSQGESLLAARAATSLRNLLNISESISPILKLPAPAATELPTINGGNAGGDNNLSQQ